MSIDPHVTGVLLSLVAVMLALLSPGPNIMAVIGTSMAIGRRSGIALACGVATGTFLWVSLTVAGFTAVLAAYAEVMFVLKIAGGCYLLWLGYKSLRSAASQYDVRERAIQIDGGIWPYFRRGLTVQMTNPKAALAMIAIVSIGVTADAPAWVGAALIVGATALSFLGHLVYALAFSTKAMIAVYARSRRTAETVLGAFFCYAGIRLLSDKQ